MLRCSCTVKKMPTHTYATLYEFTVFSDLILQLEQDAEQILELLERISDSPLSANVVRKEIGETRLLQLLKAQVLGSLPKEGPLEKLSEDLIGFGSPAMQQYFKERLQKSRVTALEEAAQAKRGSNSWTHMIFG